MSKRVVRNRRTQKIKLSSTPSLLSCLTSSKPSLVFSQALALALPALLLALVQVLVVLALVQALGEPQASILEWAQGQGKLVHTRIALVLHKLAEHTPHTALAVCKLVVCKSAERTALAVCKLVVCKSAVRTALAVCKLVEHTPHTPLQVHCMSLAVCKSSELHSYKRVLRVSLALHSFGKSVLRKSSVLRSFALHTSSEQQLHTRSRLEQCTKKLRSWSLVQLHKRRCRQRLE
mmetsp:Transcript_43924/g.69540  ORF Transcript_43924/g.69540 Transcript_43924/m.69540 type:complete len:234 (-) Transcript_43924:101-802(-)